MKKVDAQSSIEVNCHCPYCNSFQNIFDAVRDCFSDELIAKDVDVEIKCDRCKKCFIVENIHF